MHLDSRRSGWYGASMFLLSLVILAVVFYAKHLARKAAQQPELQYEEVLMAHYHCDMCDRDFVMEFMGYNGVVCPNCGPLFQELEDSVEWNSESN